MNGPAAKVGKESSGRRKLGAPFLEPQVVSEQHPSPSSLNCHSVVQLQGSAGNGAVTHLLVQRKGEAGPTGTKPSGADLPSVFSRFVGMLRTLDRKLEGHATQSWGMIIYGEGDGKDAPATKASKDAKLTESFDYAEFAELMELILTAVPAGTAYLDQLKDMRDELNARKPEKAAEFMKKLLDEISKIGSPAGPEESRLGGAGRFAGTAASAERKRSAGPRPSATKTNTPNTAPKRVKLGQWVAYDLSGNQYAMLRYSDGSKRFMFGSIYGTKDIGDPGPMEWKKVQGPDSAPKSPDVPKGSTSPSSGSQTSSLTSELAHWIANLKTDVTYGGLVQITSGVRNPESDARAVLKNQRSDPTYYKIFTANWEEAILASVEGRDLQEPVDFSAAVAALAAWIVEKPSRSPHVAGRAVDFAMAGGDAGFKDFIKSRAESVGFLFVDESKKHHYHVQMKN